LPVVAGVDILCVDDDPDTCASLSDILTNLGYRVDVACDGPSALQLVKRNGYGVALLDYGMPGMDGLGTLSAHQASPLGPGHGFFRRQEKRQ
jgi:CheY-like chemotaxis protein